MSCKELDAVKIEILKDTKNAFFGSLMLISEFEWTDSIPTCATDGVTVFFNKDYFFRHNHKQRVSCYRHELEHIARLHESRVGNRNRRVFNMACDYVINNHMDNEKFELTKDFLVDHSFDGMSEEQVYELLLDKSDGNDGSYQDMIGDGSSLNQQNIVNVQKAITHTKMMGGNVSEGIEKLINKFVDPKVPWTTVLEQFLQEMDQRVKSWSRKNRRYDSVYLPGLKKNENSLMHINFYFDTSASMRDSELTQCVSEIRHIYNHFEPESFNLVQFDIKIQRVTGVNETFDGTSIVIKGGGGTSLEPVKNHIENTKCNIAIILSDMDCQPMVKPNTTCNVVWITINSLVTPSFGKVIRINV